MPTKPSNHPFLSPEGEAAYASEKIIRRITDISSGDSWPLDSIMSKMDDDDAADKREYERLARIKDVRSLQSEIEKSREEKEKKKSRPRPVKIYSIQSLDEDGMSWCSQMVYDAVQARNSAAASSGYNISCFRPAVNNTKFPAASSIIGEKKFTHLLYQAGILKRTWLGKNAKLLIRSFWAVAGAMTQVNAELEHLEPVRHNILPEPGIDLPVLFGFCRKVKKYKYPHDAVSIESFKHGSD